MARHVAISTFSTPHQCYDGSGIDRAVDKVIEHWGSELDRAAPDDPDLIVLPETCDSYSGMALDQAFEYHEAKGEKVKAFFQERARAGHCYICYSSWRVLSDGSRRNSIQLINRRGDMAGIYDKNYPVIPEIEDCNIKSGRGQVLIETDFGRICCAICFDLNFDALREKTAALGPDLILFSSVYHGGLMQEYWAYSCRAHFAGAVANLPSKIISPDGRALATTTNYFHHVTCKVNLDCKLVHLDGNWDKLASMKARYGTQIKVTDPGYLGAVLLSSESDDFSVGDLIEEFDIELLDGYLRRSEAVCRSPGNVASTS